MATSASDSANERVNTTPEKKEEELPETKEELTEKDVAPIVQHNSQEAQTTPYGDKELRALIDELRAMKDEFHRLVQNLDGRLQVMVEESVTESVIDHNAELLEKLKGLCDRGQANCDGAEAAADKLVNARQIDTRVEVREFLVEHAGEAIESFLERLEEFMAKLDEEVIQHRDGRVTTALDEMRGTVTTVLDELRTTIRHELANSTNETTDKINAYTETGMQWRTNTHATLLKVAKGEEATRDLMTQLLNEKKSNGVNNRIITLRKDMDEFKPLEKSVLDLTKRFNSLAEQTRDRLGQLEKPNQATSTASTALEPRVVILEKKVGILDRTMDEMTVHFATRISALESMNSAQAERISALETTNSTQAQTNLRLQYAIIGIENDMLRAGFREERR